MTAPHTMVSGGSGYVGRFVVEELLAAGHEVTVLGRRPPPEGFFSRPVQFRPLMLEPGGISEALFQTADYLVHGAFDHVPGKYRGGEGDDPQGFRRRNLDGSRALFAAAKAAGVGRVAFLSSRAVYGVRPPGMWLDEQDELRPDTLYGEVKVRAEEALHGLGSPDFSGVSLRVTGVYGPAGPGRPHKWAGLFADYLAGRPVAPRIATEVHGRDVAAAVRLVLEHERLPETVFNLSDIVVDRRDILALVQRMTGTTHTLPARGDEGTLNPMRTERLRSLGWCPGGVRLLEETVEQLLVQSTG